MQIVKSKKTGKSRMQIEEEERVRWVSKLSGLIQEAQLPFWEHASSSLEPEKAMMRCGGRRRGSTIRARVRIWNGVRWWLLTAFKTPFPNKVYMMTSFLECAASEPCARSYPAAVAASLAFMEKAGSVPEDDRISKSDVWITTYGDIQMHLEQDADVLEKFKSPMYFMMMLLAMELMVCCEEYPSYQRGYAWLKAVQVWDSLRTDDTRGMPPGRLRTKQMGLVGGSQYIEIY